MLEKLAFLTGRGNRVRTPTVLQMEAVECGAASLSIILRHHGLFLPLEELRIACGVSRDGSTAKNLLRAARSYGLEAKGFRYDIPTLETLKPPFIVFWKFNHFLVVEGMSETAVFLNDPASGPRKVTRAEFDKDYTGVTLTFQPTDTFKPGGKPPGVLPDLLARLQGSKPAIYLTIGVSLLLVIPGLVIPGISRFFVDEFLVKGASDLVRPMLLGFLLVIVLKAGLDWLQQRLLLRMETKFAIAGSAKFMWHVLSLPAAFFSQRQLGDIANRIQSNDRVAVLLSGDLGKSAVNLLVVVFFLAIMVSYDIVLTLISLVMTSLSLLTLKLIDRVRTDLSLKVREENSKCYATTISGVMMIENIKASGIEDSFFGRWAGFQARAMNSQQHLDRISSMVGVVPMLLTAINAAAILGFGGYQVIDGMMTVGSLVAFQSLAASFNRPVSELIQASSKLSAIKSDLARIGDVEKYAADSRNQVSEDLSGRFPPRLSGHLELKNISFGYSPLDPPMIQDFSLCLKPGARVALVGGSGSGKSTIAKIVAGINKPWTGQVLLDGIDIREIPAPVLSNTLACVDQDIFLFEGTIRDNLRIWDAHLPDEWIHEAARDAAVHDVITASPGGYDAQIAEGGSNLSGGQRQRLEIARALAYRPTILVMDEATSALDTITEQEVDENIRRRGCTCIIVAHRLSTIRDSDEIIVFDKGSIVGRGTHETLAATCPTYQRLMEA